MSDKKPLPIFTPATPIYGGDYRQQNNNGIFHNISIENDSDSSENSEDSNNNNSAEYIPYQMPVANTTRRITNDEQFWNYIDSLYWRDVSEDPTFNLSAKKSAFKSLSIADQEMFASILTKYTNELIAILNSKDFFNITTSQRDKEAFCSHVVGKGSVFFAMTCEDTGFASYLLNPKEYRNLMEFIYI